MKDWILDYIRSRGRRVSDELFNNIKHASIDVILKDENLARSYITIAEYLAENLSYNFIHKEEDYRRFIVLFGSVLSDIGNDKYDYLCKSKNLVYILGTSEKGYVKTVNVVDPSVIEKERAIKVIVFPMGILQLNNLLIRYVIIHEILHVFK